MPRLFDVLYQGADPSAKQAQAYQELDHAAQHADRTAHPDWVILHLTYHDGHHTYQHMPHSMAQQAISQIKASPQLRAKLTRAIITRWGQLPDPLCSQCEAHER